MAEVDNYKWSIEYKTYGLGVRRAILYHDVVIDDLSIFNYVQNDPIALMPISETVTLILSQFSKDEAGFGLKIHDIRLTDEGFTSSLCFVLRGNSDRIVKLSREIRGIASLDHHRCVDLSYFLRKLYNNGFNVIMAPKVLRPKTRSTLGSIFSMAKTSMLPTSKEDNDVR